MVKFSEIFVLGPV